MPSIDWVQVVASLVLIGTGLMFVFRPTLAMKLLDFAHLVLGDRDLVRCVIARLKSAGISCRMSLHGRPV
jgi:hypothetical protein